MVAIWLRSLSVARRDNVKEWIMETLNFEEDIEIEHRPHPSSSASTSNYGKDRRFNYKKHEEKKIQIQYEVKKTNENNKENE